MAAPEQISLLNPLPNPLTGNERYPISQNNGGGYDTYYGTPGNFLFYAITPAETAAALALSISITTLVVNQAYPELYPSRYGIDTTGAIDATAAVIKWLAVAEQYNGVILRYAQAGTCRLDGGLTIDTNKTGIDWSGATLDFTHFTGLYGIQFAQSQVDPNLQVLLNGAHPISNAYVLGPGGASGATAMYLNASAGNYVAGCCFRNLSFLNWTADVILSAGAFCNRWDHCTFTIDELSGTDLTYSIQIASGNPGERNVFTDCFWFNRNYHVDALSGNSDTYFYNCSFDTFITSLNVVAGTVVVSGGHMENANDAAIWGSASGGTLMLSNVALITQVAKTSFDFFQSTAGTGGGVFIRDCPLQSGSLAITTRLVSGTGYAKVDNVIQGFFGARPVLGGSYLNLLAYGDMESTSWANDWTLAGTTLPVRDTAVFHGGTASMKIVGVVSQAVSASATMTRGCKPGQFMQGEMWYMAPAIAGTGATFTYSLLYLDASGGAIAGSGTTISITANVAGWTHAVIANANPAPTGTVSCELQLGVSTPTSGAPIVNVDDMLINVT
jgi:hypothetical protein